jgi:hypothetical protein
MSTQLLALTALTALTTESATLLASSYSVNGNEPTSGAKLLASAPNTDATHLFDALQRTLACEDAHRHTGSAKYTTPAQEEVTVELVRYIGGEKLELVLALDLLETAHPSVYAANISKTPTSDRVWRQDSLLLECAFTMLAPELEGHSAPEGYTWAQARKHAEEARQQARAIIAAWAATETPATETPAAETATMNNKLLAIIALVNKTISIEPAALASVLASSYSVNNNEPASGAKLLADADDTDAATHLFDALHIAHRGNGTSDTFHVGEVDLVTRMDADLLAVVHALDALEGESPEAYDLVNESMTNAKRGWRDCADLVRVALDLEELEEQGWEPVGFGSWQEALEARDEALEAGRKLAATVCPPAPRVTAPHTTETISLTLLASMFRVEGKVACGRDILEARGYEYNAYFTLTRALELGSFNGLTMSAELLGKYEWHEAHALRVLAQLRKAHPEVARALVAEASLRGHADCEWNADGAKLAVTLGLVDGVTTARGHKRADVMRAVRAAWDAAN